jgi:hypothetical protein
VLFDINPRNFHANDPRRNVRSQCEIDVIGIAATMNIHSELWEVRATALSLELKQPLLELIGGRYRVCGKYRRA